MIWEPVLAKFKELFGDEGEIGVYFAPGRVNMIGEHTDYNGGHVFPCALTIGTYGVARKRDDKKLRFYSMNFEESRCAGVFRGGPKAGEGSRLDELPEGCDVGVRREGHESGVWYGSRAVRQYSERFRIVFFRIGGSADRIHPA